MTVLILIWVLYVYFYRGMIRMQSAVLPQQAVCLSVCPSFHLPVTLRYRNHIGWKSPKSLLVSLWCSLSADANTTDLLQREHPKIRTQLKWPTPCRIECRRYSMANFGRMVRDSAMITTGAYRKPPSPSFHCYDRWHQTASPSLKMGSKMHPRDITSNSEWPYLRNGWSDLLHVRF